MTLQQLDDIEQRLALATCYEDVAGATLQLVMELRADAERPPSPELTTLRQLLREAFELLNDPDSTLDRRDWTREAKKWL